MKWQYRIEWHDGKTGTCIANDRVYDCMRHFRNRFSEDIVSVHERLGGGEWHPSTVLPTCAEEAESNQFQESEDSAA
tara:strand:- start:56 stop:286 length:231 start_codon:yes stop_codon:yes gene_type:complete